MQDLVILLYPLIMASAYDDAVFDKHSTDWDAAFAQTRPRFFQSEFHKCLGRIAIEWERVASMGLLCMIVHGGPPKVAQSRTRLLIDAHRIFPRFRAKK